MIYVYYGCFNNVYIKDKQIPYSKGVFWINTKNSIILINKLPQNYYLYDFFADLPVKAKIFFKDLNEFKINEDIDNLKEYYYISLLNKNIEIFEYLIEKYNYKPKINDILKYTVGQKQKLLIVRFYDL